MVKRKTTAKKVKKKSRSSKSKSSRTSPRKTSAHKYNEKMIITAMVSVIFIGLVIWVSQDFPAQGQAYQVQLDLQEKVDLSTTVLTSCQTSNGCAFIESIINHGAEQATINKMKVNIYELVFYDFKGEEISGTFSGDLKADGVVTVGYKGFRFPVDDLIISSDF